MKPVIGITVAHVEEEISTYPREYYVQSVTDAGGIPILLPVVSETKTSVHYLKLINGLVLSGGSDVDASYFRQEPLRGTGKVYGDRDKFEVEFTQKALEVGLPILGICRGAQVLNIAAGGDIYQDIYSQMPGLLEHNQKTERSRPWHSVSIMPESILGKLSGVGEIRVNSFHHQAIRNVAPGFRSVARAKDGIIEGIESTIHEFVIGVQWHPEAMTTDQFSNALFAAFIAACMEE